MLQVERLGKRFGLRWIFRGVEFQLNQGDCLVVTGPNGSGKSTLLKILAGLVEPTEGRFAWPGRKLINPCIGHSELAEESLEDNNCFTTEMSRQARHDRNVDESDSDIKTALGYAALDLALYPALTATEHLQLAARTRALPPESTRCLEKVGLDHAQNQLVSQFSTGMRMRLKLALAVQAEPPMLLLDEPSAALDSAGQVILDQILREQLQRGLAILATNSNQEANYATQTLELAS